MSDVAPPTKIGVREFRANLSTYLKQAEAGAHIAVVSRDKVLAELHPPSLPKPRPDSFGCMRGQIWIAPDSPEHDAEMEELFDIMENGEVFPPDPSGSRS